ncbi:LysM peptidoglycan-binding domain-containing protein [Listeria booriae]|uniref:LysM peptidoglycan-binding domain-containing protein n=1 Tax=Listeria booriae TaxID=1552123 RepID=UPI00162A2333|nr:LysM peptidoglycan-binding domain-containing protein [Listeria booriae]MBC2169782.1 LysM peptidoglycan-binding domain-containing protein [Listeria booriae]
MKKAALATATAGIAVTAFAAPTIASANTVIVQAGDTLWGIAQKAGTDVDTIKKANKLTSDTIHPGQKLEIVKQTEEATKAVNSTWLNVRQGPSVDNSIITSIKGGTQVTVQSTETNGWNKVEYADGKTGYVNGKYLSDVSEVTAPVADPTPSAPSTTNETVTEQETTTPSPEAPKAEVTQPAAEQEVSANATTYTVKNGDTLWALSTKFGVSVQKLMSWNNLSSSSIYVGQVLAVAESEAKAPQAEQEVTAPAPKEEAPETVTEEATPPVQEEAKEETQAPTTPPKEEQKEVAPVVQVDTNASTYTVQAGDSLGKIATLFGTSVANLKALNNLSDDTIIVGDELKVKGSAPVKETVTEQEKQTPEVKPETQQPTVKPETQKPSNPAPSVTKPSKPTVDTSNTTNYTVQSGDSYYTIAQKFGTTVDNLKALNNATSDNLQVGDVLKVKGTASNTTNVNKPSSNNNASKPSNTNNNNSNSSSSNTNNNSNSSSSSASYSSLINEAEKHLGKAYSWGGNGPSTFDCSGYTKYVFAKLGISIPRTSGSQYAAATKISASQAQPGDLVFFNYGSGIAHVGIYVGNGQMINAQDNGVKYDNITSGYWAKYLVGYGRVANF